MKMISCRASQRARAGMTFVKFVLVVLVTSVLTVIGWEVYTNWHLDADGDGQPDGFTLRMTSREWWRAGFEDAKDLVAKGEPYLDKAKERIWGADGLVDDAKDWLAERRERQSRTPATTAPVSVPAPGEQKTDGEAVAVVEPPGEKPAAGPETPIAVQPNPGTHQVKPIGRSEVENVLAKPPTSAPAGPSPRCLRMEERFDNIEENFAQGIDCYEKADPSKSEWTDQRAKNIHEAHKRFAAVRDDLDVWLPEYKALPDHDPALVSQAERLAQLNQPLLQNASKMDSTE